MENLKIIIKDGENIEYNYNFFKEGFEEWARNLDADLNRENLKRYLVECGYNVIEFIAESYGENKCIKIELVENVLELSNKLEDKFELISLMEDDDDYEIATMLMFTNFVVGKYERKWVAVNLPEQNGSDGFDDIGKVYTFEQKPTLKQIFTTYKNEEQ